MLVGYARVSTDLQTTDGQIDALKAARCERAFKELMSGTRTDRPQLAAALEFAREGDVLVVARLDRLARSMRQLLTTVDALQARGIGLRSLHENIDTTSATGRLILHIFAALGQFEVELLRERTRTALAASRARGRIGGRPPALDAIKIKAAKAMLASGTMTASEVARQVGCSASTLYRHVPGGRTAVAESGVPAAADQRELAFSRGGISSKCHGQTDACHQLPQAQSALAVLCCIERSLRQWPVSCEEARPRGQDHVRQHQKYNVRRGSAEHLARRVREGFVPMMRQMEGFRGYYLLDGGPDVLITISIFDSADEAFASNEKAADWVRNNVLEFTKGMPEVMVGNALIAEVK